MDGFLMEVKAPNGDVYDLPKAVATGLINSAGSGWSKVERPQRAPAKKAAPKPPEK